MSPFDFINSIQAEKNYVLSDETEKDYNQFVINRGLSFGADTIIYGNEMNSRPHLSSKMQYDFLFHGIPKRKRYNKWIKADKIDNIDIITEYYECSDVRAKEILRLLTDDQVEQIRKRLFKGGVL